MARYYVTTARSFFPAVRERTRAANDGANEQLKPASQPPAVPAKPVFSHSIHSFIPRLLKIEPTPVKTSALCVSLLLCGDEWIVLPDRAPFPLQHPRSSKSPSLFNPRTALFHAIRSLHGLWASITWLALCKNQLTHLSEKLRSRRRSYWSAEYLVARSLHRQ